MIESNNNFANLRLASCAHSLVLHYKLTRNSRWIYSIRTTTFLKSPSLQLKGISERLCEYNLINCDLSPSIGGGTWTRIFIQHHGMMGYPTCKRLSSKFKDVILSVMCLLIVLTCTIQVILHTEHKINGWDFLWTGLTLSCNTDYDKYLSIEGFLSLIFQCFPEFCITLHDHSNLYLT